MNNTKKAFKEAERTQKDYYDNYMSLFKMLFHESVKVENSDVPKRYLLRVLLNKGGIAYDKQTGLFLPYSEGGVDVYGLPLYYILTGYNGYVVMRKPEEVVILRANDNKFPIIRYFEQQAKKLVNIDVAINQNIEAVKTMTIGYVEDNSALLSIANEAECRRVGATLIFKNKKATAGSTFETQNTGAQYISNDLLETRKEIMNETFSLIGIAVANTDKRERVQGLEVQASQGFAKDCLRTLVETFNYDAEYGGLEIRLKANTSLILENEIENELKKSEIKENNNENTSRNDTK